jgi:hypothetical protein
MGASTSISLVTDEGDEYDDDSLRWIAKKKKIAGEHGYGDRGEVS